MDELARMMQRIEELEAIKLPLSEDRIVTGQPALLHAAEAKYRTLVEQIPAITYIAALDEASTTLFVSPQVGQFLGVSQDDYRADPDMWRKRLHPGDHDRVLSEVARSHETGEPLISEYRMVARDGRVVWFSDSALVVKGLDGQPIFLQGIMWDITRRKEAEEELRRSEERFRRIFESARDCIYIKDPNLRYTHVNPAMERILGMKAEELLSKRDDELFGTEAGKHTKAADIRVLNGETIEEEQTRPVRGEPLTFHDIRAPLMNADGRIIGICGVSRNITERKRMDPATPAGVMNYPSRAMRAAMERAALAAATDGIVLLQGESGTGKDYLARWIHANSRRAKGLFFAINCAAISKELAESELFGHEHGAFTGTHGRKRGLLELAEGGTLLLNEIGELSLSLQSKLLTFLDTRTFLRVGGEKTIQVNARIIAATHRDLETEVEEGRFLPALWYRLDVFTIRVPPLRERVEDLPILVREILEIVAAEIHLTSMPVIGPTELEVLSRYHWPGNVRELRNVLERTVMVSDSGTLNLNLPFRGEADGEWSCAFRFGSGQTLRDATDAFRRSVCVEALRRAGGNKRKAAQGLGISRDSLYRYLQGDEASADI